MGSDRGQTGSYSGQTGSDGGHKGVRLGSDRGQTGSYRGHTGVSRRVTQGSYGRHIGVVQPDWGNTTCRGVYMCFPIYLQYLLYVNGV